MLGLGRTGSHATAPPATTPPCGNAVRHQRAPPGEETHDPNPGPHEQGVRGTAAWLQHCKALPARGASRGRRGPRRLRWPLSSAMRTGKLQAPPCSQGQVPRGAHSPTNAQCFLTRGHPGPLRPAPSARRPGSQRSAAGAASCRGPGAWRRPGQEASGDGGPFMATLEPSLRNNECPSIVLPLITRSST